MVATSHKGLQDTPTLDVVQNLQRLCVLVLQPLRDAIGRPVYINSGYRSKRLNARVGGVPNSYHLRGLAADIHVDNDEHAKVLFDILKQNKWVDLVIREWKTATTPNPPSVARSALPLSERQRGKNGGFAPICGAAAIPMAALKTSVAPVAFPKEGTTCWLHVQTRTDGRQRRRAIW